MFTFIINQIFFFAAIALTMFLPGWFLLLAVFGKSKDTFASIEKLIISFGLGLIVTDFIAFAYSKLGIRIDAVSSVLGSLIFVSACYGIYEYKQTRTIRKQVQASSPESQVSEKISSEDKDAPEIKGSIETIEPAIIFSANRVAAAALQSRDDKNLFNFSKKQLSLILIFLFLTIFLKTTYLTGTVAPTATDLGHHMYWAKEMTETGHLPTYDGMPDFIIGEHIIFGIIASITHLSFFSAFPVVLLYLINILAILAVFILTLRFFENKNIAILSLLFIGVIFSISSPQAKFVSGGVVGNTMGNFLLPLIFYFYLRAFSFFQKEKMEPEKNSRNFLAIAIFLNFGLFYTHHLTAFIFLFVFVILAIVFAITNYDQIETIFKKIKAMILTPQVIGTFLVGIFFFFFVFTPTYVNPKAVDTAVGTPSKATRVGLSFSEMESTNGEIRMALGILGLIILALNYKRKNFGYALAGSWLVALLLMSMWPNWLFIDLPSSRVGNYTSYPLAIMSAYGFYIIIRNKIFEKDKEQQPTPLPLPEKLIRAGFFSILIFTFAFGMTDFASSFKNKNNGNEVAQVFDASNYLAQKTTPEDNILKDHNYLTADSWIKLFFMRGYKYPDSRGLFKRYEDPTKPREMCTLQMISEPATPEAKECFSQTKTNFIAINPRYDSAQFQRLDNFNQIYDSGYVMVYYKKSN